MSAWPLLFRALLIFTLILGASGCRSTSDELTQHHKKIQSLKSTAAAVGRAWSAGDVSSTFARTALEQTFQLLEEERTTLVRSAAVASQQGFAAVIEDAEAASRTIAALDAAVQSADRSAAQRRVAELSTLAAGKQA